MNLPALYSVVPSFSLPEARDRHPVSLLDYRQAMPVVLLCCGDDCAPLLHDFAGRYGEYRDAGAEVLGIVTGRLDGEQPPFPVLIDSDGQVTARLVERTPALLVLDSYGELQARLLGPWPNGPAHRDILHEIVRLEMQCPECGAPAWPRA